MVEKKVHIFCITETHLDEKRERLLISIFEDKFECISRIREERKRGDYGSGGVAVMIRKTKGKIKTIKRKGADGILWVEVEGTGRKMFVAVVYIVPTKSTRYVKNTELRRELEEDIMRYKQEGMVMVMGDLNSRIGEIEHHRRNKDIEVNENGREWMALTRATGMTILSGLNETADYTCFNEQGNSVVDHICIDESYKEVVMKLENRRDVMARIDTDHSMVVAKIKTEKPEEGGGKRRQVKIKQGGNQKEKRRNANRIKKKEVWAEYESRCNKSMEIAKLIDKLDKRAERGEKTVEEAWQKVKKAARKLEIWMEEIAEEKGDLEYEYINKASFQFQDRSRLNGFFPLSPPPFFSVKSKFLDRS